MEHLDEPGAEDLYAYLESGEYEDFTAEWYDEAIEMGMLADNDRQEGGYSEAGFRNFNKNPAVMKGNHKYGNTVAYCKAVNDIKKPSFKPPKYQLNPIVTTTARNAHLKKDRILMIKMTTSMPSTLQNGNPLGENHIRKVYFQKIKHLDQTP